MADTINSVNFFPTKRLLVDIITKDINIHDSILDLIDNSVDSYVRHKLKDKREINIEISSKSLIIKDNCGGIDKTTLLEHVFRSGELPSFSAQTIGYYGIGLKRALFKLADKFVFETYDGKDHSQISMNVKSWREKEDDNWNLPLDNVIKSVVKGKKPFTKITVTKYKEEIPRILTTIFINKLKDNLGIYYTRFIENKIDILFNGIKIKPFDLAATYSKEMKPIFTSDTFDGVKFKIYCWIEPQKGSRDTLAPKKIGWNIFMNDRLIMVNDTSPITGWSGDNAELPKYHPIFNQFRGIVMIESSDLSLLPINTTKNNFNEEHPVYHHIKKKMIDNVRPIVTYLNNRYNRNKIENVDSEIELEINKDIVDRKNLKSTKIDSLKLQSKFTPAKSKSKSDATPISYKKPQKQVEIIKKNYKLKSNKEVGEYTFDYFWKLEGLKDE